VRERIPVFIAAIGPKNVELTAEIAEGWEPIFFVPEKAAEVWGGALAAGQARRDPALGPLEIVVQAPLAIGDDVTHLREAARPLLALYIGGMGARSRNFYNDLACRYGYQAQAAQIQDLYLSGKKDEAAAAVPAELLERTSLIGPDGYVAERLAALRAAGVSTVNVTPLAPDHASRVALIERAAELAGRS
jgi:F420-dependent oxidoreductase-like protein